MDLILVSIGGALGSITRYKVGSIVAVKSKSQFPLGTFIINISGAFLLGLLLNLRVEKSITLFFADGFLGAYTTFSTFMYEGFSLFRSKKLNAVFYILSSVVLGILGFYMGYSIVNMF